MLLLQPTRLKRRTLANRSPGPDQPERGGLSCRIRPLRPGFTIYLNYLIPSLCGPSRGRRHRNPPSSHSHPQSRTTKNIFHEGHWTRMEENPHSRPQDLPTLHPHPAQFLGRSTGSLRDPRGRLLGAVAVVGEPMVRLFGRVLTYLRGAGGYFLRRPLLAAAGVSGGRGPWAALLPPFAPVLPLVSPKPLDLRGYGGQPQRKLLLDSNNLAYRPRLVDLGEVQPPLGVLGWQRPSVPTSLPEHITFLGRRLSPHYYPDGRLAGVLFRWWVEKWGGFHRHLSP